jgi:hypothetical protein
VADDNAYNDQFPGSRLTKVVRTVIRAVLQISKLLRICNAAMQCMPATFRSVVADTQNKQKGMTKIANEIAAANKKPVPTKVGYGFQDDAARFLLIRRLPSWAAFDFAHCRVNLNVALITNQESIILLAWT